MLTRVNCAVFLALVCALILSTGALSADPTQARTDAGYTASAPVAVEPQPVRVALAAGTGQQTASQEDKNITLDFHGADITDVLKALSMQAGKNIVTGTDVKGTVTVSLSRVSFSEALDMVTKLSGYTYALASPNTYIVGTVPGVGGVTGNPDLETSTATVALAYADPEQICKMLEAQMPNIKTSMNGKPDQPGPKLLVMSGPKKQVEQASDMVAKIESTIAEKVKSDGASKVIEVYRLKFADAKTAVAMLQNVLPRLTVLTGPGSGLTDTVPSGITFSSSSGGTVAAGTSTSSTQTGMEPRTLILSGTPDDVAKAKNILAEVDVRPKQVLIETKFTDITVGAQKRLGITWSWDSIGFNERTNASGGGESAWYRLPVNFEAELDAMLKDNSAKLLANPSIAAIEGKQAVIFIGDEIKYIINIQETLTGITFQTETASVGVTLRVVARPDEDGYITLALHPEVSTISDWLTIGTGTGGNNAKTAIALPQIARRFTDHTVRVKDGETIVIGGLIRDNEISNLSKVPLLGDLPVLGGLFRHREKQKEHSDIVVFIKASLMKD
jgi:type II secretory pathway component GspD/PulD (secretin)